MTICNKCGKYLADTGEPMHVCILTNTITVTNQNQSKEQASLLEEALEKMSDTIASCDSHYINAIGPEGTIAAQIIRPILKEVIDVVREEERGRIIKMIEGKKYDTPDNHLEQWAQREKMGYNQALSDIINKLKVEDKVEIGW